MISLLRKRPQGIALSVTTKKFLRDCPPEFKKLREKVEQYQSQLTTLKLRAG